MSSSFNSATESDSNSNAELEEPWRNSVIEEVSEPMSPEEDFPSDHSAGTSVIAEMLRRSPPQHQQLEIPQEQITEDHQDARLRGVSNDVLIPGKGLSPAAPAGVVEEPEPSEETPLILKDTTDPSHPDWIRGDQDLERQEIRRETPWPRLHDMLAWPRQQGAYWLELAAHPKRWDRKEIWQHAIVAPAGYLPAVILGVLLNILDALSYGMILFPLGEPIFAKLGAAGISMFYVSCIVSQLVYSCGGSIFRGGIGSEMIEVVPFFHKMAFLIMNTVGEDNPRAVIATTITSYAISSIITGVVFFLMGSCGFGYIVGFIPRHILIGCIGGVGWFLIATGFEVTARLDGNLTYDIATLKQMFQPDTLPLWLIPFVLAVFLYWSQHKITSKYYLPIFILAIPAVFYFFVLSLDQLDPAQLREAGWIFNGPEAGEPWWYFYTLYGKPLSVPFSSMALVLTIPWQILKSFAGTH